MKNLPLLTRSSFTWPTSLAEMEFVEAAGPGKTTSRLREGYAEASRNVGQPTRRITSPQVPTQRLRGPTRTGRLAGAFAVKMHSKKKLLN